MSSFRKRNLKTPITGTRTSPQTGQLITSSGNPSFDVLLGGGLPIGSICLIEEDKYVTHSKVLAKYFLAEGVSSYHSTFLASLDDDPDDFMSKLPSIIFEKELGLEAAMEKESDEDAESNKNGLRIAWRYNDLPIINSEQRTESIGHQYNLLEYMDLKSNYFAIIETWNDTTKDKKLEYHEKEDGFDGYKHDHVNSSKDVEMENAKNVADNNKSEEKPKEMDLDQSKSEEIALQVSQELSQKKTTKAFHHKRYLPLVSKISRALRSESYQPSDVYDNNIYRICITSLASPLWYDDNFSNDILKFLTILRANVRSALAVCFITMPMHLVAKYDESLVAKIRNLVDFSIELESFAGSDRETNPAFRDYHGLLHLHKIAAINTLSARNLMPETSDLAFKLRRKKFVIEKLHLPPELQESNSADNQTDIVPTLSCGSSNTGANPKAPSLDF